MQKYIDQLLEDISGACKPVNEIQSHDNSSLQEHFKEIEELVNAGVPEHDFSYYCGLREQQFPAPELLTKSQIRSIFKAFSKLVLSYNISVLIPRTVPLPEAYSFLISILSKKIFIVEFGNVVIEFCTDDPGACPFKEHCLCKKHQEREEEEEQEYLIDDKRAFN